MLKKFICTMLVVACFSSCSIVSKEDNSGPQLSLTSDLTSSPANSSSQEPGTQANPISRFELFRVNLKGNMVPERLKIGIGNDEPFFMNPACTLLIQNLDSRHSLYLCDHDTLIEYNKYAHFDGFVDENRLTYFMGAEDFTFSGDKEDGLYGMTTENWEIKNTVFLVNFLDAMGEGYQARMWGGVQFDQKLKRYYAMVWLNGIDDQKPDMPCIVCVEYDEEFNMLDYIMAKDIEWLVGNKGYPIYPRIVALGNRVVYTNQKIEFDFTTGTFERIDYAFNDNNDPYNPGVIEGFEFPTYKNGENMIRTNDNIKVLSYIGDDLTLMYETPFRTQDSVEVKTDQGIVTLLDISIGNAMWAPDEGVYFVGGCEKFTWRSPPELTLYFQDSFYDLAVFKLMPDGSIQFVIPLPSDISFCGEDMHNRSYFFRKLD